MFYVNRFPALTKSPSTVHSQMLEVLSSSSISSTGPS